MGFFNRWANFFGILTHNTSNMNTIDSVTGAYRFSHRAMATIYEIFIVHEDSNYAQQAAHEAFCELDRLEQDLSRFIENSDIARINKLSANQPLQLGPAAFECLQQAAQMYKETNGAFDITIGPLLKCWMNRDKTPRLPSEEELEQARQHSGFHFLQLDENAKTVSVKASPVHIDLGGIGKGYAVDKLVELLCDWEIDTAMIHGGTSSVFALGAPTELKGWPVTLSNPKNKQTLTRVHLRDQALSGSGLQKGQHIIDPRTARPVEGNLAAWACAPNTAATDALSTAFMIMRPDEVEAYCAQNQNVLAMIVTGENDHGKDNVLYFGHWDENDIQQV